jgi:hypothetical protein
MNLVDRQELDLKDKGGIGRDESGKTSGAV